MSKRFKRNMSICLLISFLFLPFSRPKEAKAFAFPVALGGVLPVIGATILVLGGCVFIDTEMSKFEGEKLMKEHGDKILFQCKRPLQNFSEWIKGSEMTFDDWTFWNGSYRVEETKEDKEWLQKYINDIPTKPQPGLDHTFSETFTFPAYSYHPASGNNAEFDFVIEVLGELEGYSKNELVFSNIQNGQITRFQLPLGYPLNTKFNVHGHASIWGGSNMSVSCSGAFVGSIHMTKDYVYKPGVFSYDTDKFRIYVPGKEMPYNPGVTENASADKFYDRTNGKDLSIDKDKEGGLSYPLQDNPDLSIEQSLENSGAGTIEKDQALTGWKWLDNILNAILSAIKAIPSAIGNLFVPSEFDVVDFSPLYVGITDKFPFSIPWDIKNIIGTLDSDPIPPNFELRWNGHKFNLDLTVFSNLFGICRTFILLTFVVSLAIKTRDIIKS